MSDTHEKVPAICRAVVFYATFIRVEIRAFAVKAVIEIDSAKIDAGFGFPFDVRAGVGNGSRGCA